MEIKVGCDIVHIPRFKKSAKAGGTEFLGKIFTSHELAGAPSLETLAGMFAAKEAIIKARDLKAGDWHKIEITKNKAGKPAIRILSLQNAIASHDVSISHDGEYAFAVVGFLVDDTH